jgi:uncharacterized protein YcbK (DUF882 family)
MKDLAPITDLKEICARWRWPNFNPSEFMCHGTQTYKIIPYSMDCLQALRSVCGFPFRINSGYRSPEYNAKVAETGLDGPHTTGQAFDIAVAGQHAFRLLTFAAQYGFTGIGVKQKGPMEGRYIHLDTLAEGTRPWVWSY